MHLAYSGEEVLMNRLSVFQCPVNSAIDGFLKKVLWILQDEKLPSLILFYLDCEDKQHLKDFYINKHHYKIFGERYSHSDSIRYLQMIRFF